MALIKCIECGKKISDKANRCPYCGAPIEMDKTYDEIEKDIVTVKISNIVIILFFIIICGLGLYWTIFLFNTTSIGIYSIIPLFISIIIALIELYNFKKTYITLTNKRIIGKIVKLFNSIEIDYPLRQIKDVIVLNFFCISIFRISNGKQNLQIGCATNAKKFKKEYFNLIENKYKY